MKHSELIELLKYDPESGKFTWLKKPSRKTLITNEVGTVRHDGYVRVRINKTFYYIHRLAWFYVYGELPSMEIDHINGNPNDNRICNLRLASRHDNAANISVSKKNKSGVTGVFWCEKESRWYSYIMRFGHKFHLGMAEDFFEAVCLRKSAERYYFGEFARGC